METIQTPEFVTVGGGEDSPTDPDDDFRVDGTWNHQGLRQGVS